MIASREKIEPKCIAREESPCQLQRAHPTTRTPNQHSPPHEDASGVNQIHDCVTISTEDDIAANIPRPNRPSDLRISEERSSGVNNCTDRSSQSNPPFQKRRGSPPPALRRSKSHYPGQHANPSNVSKRSIARLKSTKSARNLKPSSGIHKRPTREQQPAGHDQRKHERNEERLSSRAGNRTLNTQQQLLDTRKFSSSRSVRNLWTKQQQHASTKRLPQGNKKGRPPLERSKSRPQFVPQKSLRICRTFDEKDSPTRKREDDDIWVERIILNGPSGRTKTCFRSLRGNVTRNEPPTGASTIIYLEDIIVDRKQASIPPKTKGLPKLSETGSKEIKKGSFGSKTDGRSKLPPKEAQQKQRTGLFGFMKKKNAKIKN